MVEPGQIYGNLTVVELWLDHDYPSHQKWHCKCSCGIDIVAWASSLVSGNTKSCGCLQRKRTSEASTTHGEGHTATAEYRCWTHIKTRCYNPRIKNFDCYGGRGITVCERWRDSFENFLADMGRRPSPNHSIDRYPNPDGNYEPSNCRWATRSQQEQNKSKWRSKAHL